MANLDVLTQPFPEAAVKERVIGGGMRARYVDGATVIRRLNEATGNDWSFTVDRYWVDGLLGYALVTLTIPGHGSRQHVGVQAQNERSGEDAIAKGAITDALKKSATLFGVALELYGPDIEFGGTSTQQSPAAYGATPSSSVPTTFVNRQTNTPVMGTNVAGFASPKQLGFIHARAKERGIADPAGYASRLYGVSSLQELTGGREGTASAFIDWLGSYEPDDVVGTFDAPSTLGIVDVASEAATGMNAGSEKFWSQKASNMNSLAGVDAVHGEALARFGDGVSQNFLDAVAKRKDELHRLGR